MTMLEDGHAVCDRCDTDLANAAITRCLIVSDLDPDREGMVRNLHFCRDRMEDGTLTPGCAQVLLNEDNLAAYHARTSQ